MASIWSWTQYTGSEIWLNPNYIFYDTKPLVYAYWQTWWGVRIVYRQKLGEGYNTAVSILLRTFLDFFPLAGMPLCDRKT